MVYTKGRIRGILRVETILILARNLRAIRLARGLTQERLALDTRIRQEDISALERLHKPLYKSWGVRLSLALGCSEAELSDPSTPAAATT